METAGDAAGQAVQYRHEQRYIACISGSRGIKVRKNLLLLIKCPCILTVKISEALVIFQWHLARRIDDDSLSADGDGSTADCTVYLCIRILQCRDVPGTYGVLHLHIIRNCIDNLTALRDDAVHADLIVIAEGLTLEMHTGHREISHV